MSFRCSLLFFKNRFAPPSQTGFYQKNLFLRRNPFFNKTQQQIRYNSSQNKVEQSSYDRIIFSVLRRMRSVRKTVKIRIAT
jgi:hypothetical protein